MTSGHINHRLHRSARLIRSTLLISVMCLLLVATLWNFRTPLINRFGTGYLEKILSSSLAATVVLGHLDFSLSHLTVKDLNITDEGLYDLSIPSLTVRFTLKALASGEVEGLQLLRPQLRLRLPEVFAAPTPEEFPGKLPALRINLVELVDAHIDLHRQQWHLPLRSLNFRMEKAPLGTASLMVEIGDDHPLTLTAAGHIHADPAPELQLTGLTIDDTPLLKTPLRLSLANQGAIDGTIHLDDFNHGLFSNWLKIIGLDNPLPPTSVFAVRQLQVEIRLSAHSLQTHLQAPAVRIEHQGTTINLHHVNGTVKAAWAAGAIDLEGSASFSESTLQHGDVMSRGLKIQSHVKVNGPLADLQGEAELTFDGHPLLGISGNLRQQTIKLHRTETALLSDLLIDSTHWPAVVEPLGWVEATLVLKTDEGTRHGHVDMHGDQLRVKDMTITHLRFSSPFRLHKQLELTESRARFRVEGATFSAPLIHVDSSMVLTPDQVDIAISSAELAPADFLAADDKSAVAGAHLRAAGTLSLNMAQQQLRGHLSGSLLVQEALHEAFYADLSGLPVHWDIVGSWQLESGLIRAHHVYLRLADVGKLQGSGQWSSERLMVDIDLELFDLAAGFKRQLLPVLPPPYTRLQELDVSGTLSAALKMTIEGEQRRLEVLIRPRAVTLIDPSTRLQLHELEGEIPLLLAPGTASSATRQGQVHFSQLTVGPGRITSSPLVFNSTANRLSSVDTLELSIGGGHVRIDNLEIGLPPNNYSIGGQVRADNINLAQLTNDLGFKPLQGQLSADLGTVTYRNGHLRSDGDMLINLFGGEMKIRNLSAGDMFTSYRSFAADIDLTGIDLSQMTTTFEFGEINGILDGHVHNLRLFGTTPSAFVAEVRTREQGQRNISVRAIDNLSVISQGGLSAALSRGVYRFIDFYRYRQIGIFCTLHNDVFVLKGTARRGSDLYLVDGGLIPPRIDILAPQTAISFREMLRRLKRIDRSGSF